MANSRAKTLAPLSSLLDDYLRAVDIYERTKAHVKDLKEENASTEVANRFIEAVMEVAEGNVLLTRAALAEALDDAAMPSHVTSDRVLGNDPQAKAEELAEKLGRRVQVRSNTKPFGVEPKKRRRTFASLHGESGLLPSGKGTIGFKQDDSK